MIKSLGAWLLRVQPKQIFGQDEAICGPTPSPKCEIYVAEFFQHMWRKFQIFLSYFLLSYPSSWHSLPRCKRLKNFFYNFFCQLSECSALKSTKSHLELSLSKNKKLKSAGRKRKATKVQSPQFLPIDLPFSLLSIDRFLTMISEQFESWIVVQN